MAACRTTTTPIDARSTTVAGALRHLPTMEQGVRTWGLRGRAVLYESGSVGESELAVPGDEFAFRPGNIVPLLRTRVVHADARVLRTVLVAGPFAELCHDAALVDQGDRTVLVDSVRWRAPFGLFGRIAYGVLLRGLVKRVLEQRARSVRAVAESWASRSVVVGAAVVHDGQLLAQQRRHPTKDAGKWELPGGRVYPGETEHDTVVRECREELDVTVLVGSPVGTDVPLADDMVLRVHRAELTTDETPRPVEHRALRWLTSAELSEVDWLPADRALVHSLRELLHES